jgi:transcriptional regulator
MANSHTEEVRQGTLDLLILKTLSLEPLHGWGISQRIQERSREVFLVNQGSLYPALHRLESDGFVASDWRQTENNRRAKYYRLTAAGTRRLQKETLSWERFAGAVWGILEAT